jgi:hypothetical protein
MASRSCYVLSMEPCRLFIAARKWPTITILRLPAETVTSTYKINHRQTSSNFSFRVFCIHQPTLSSHESYKSPNQSCYLKASYTGLAPSDEILPKTVQQRAPDQIGLSHCQPPKTTTATANQTRQIRLAIQLRATEQNSHDTAPELSKSSCRLSSDQD